MSTLPPFDWTVDPARDWPPQSTLALPCSLTRVEIARSCALRVRFEDARVDAQDDTPSASLDASTRPPKERAKKHSRYEPLLSFDARIGTAMHLTIERLSATLPVNNLLEQITLVFQEELEKQRLLAQTKPRERGRPETQARIDAAPGAILYTLQQLQPLLQAEESAGDDRLVEQEVTSKDNMFRGRVDQAVRTADHLRLTDFKSSMKNEVPDRYARQLQMYTEMWKDTFDERPDSAWLVYPLTGREFRIDIQPETTQATMLTSRQAILPLLDGRPATDLANPGEVCKVCAFRPWCEPFWHWTAADGQITEAQLRSVYGFQGRVLKSVRQQANLILQVAWHPLSVATLILPALQFPHLEHLPDQTRVRVLNARLQGQLRSPRAVASGWTEVFLLK